MNNSRPFVSMSMLLLLLTLSSLPQTVIAQTEKLGSVKYTPPKGWTKSAKENVVTISFNYSDGRKIKIAFPGAEFDIRNQNPATLLLSYDENRLTRQ